MKEAIILLTRKETFKRMAFILVFVSQYLVTHSFLNQHLCPLRSVNQNFQNCIINSYMNSFQNIPDPSDIDPSKLSPEMREQYELMKAEEEFYKREKLLHEMKDVPMKMECHQYRWKQTEDKLTVEIPIPKMVLPKDVYLVLSAEQFYLELKNDPDFPPVAGYTAGEVDTETSSWTIEPGEEDGGYIIKVEATKQSDEGTFQMWYEFLEGEEPAPTIVFQRKTPKYQWKQTVHTVEVEIPVPSDVTKKGVHFDIDPAGKSFRLSMEEYPSYGVLEAKFFGTVSVVDSIWLLEGEDEDRKLYAMLKKKRKKDDEAEWWSGLVEGEKRV